MEVDVNALELLPEPKPPVGLYPCRPYQTIACGPQNTCLEPATTP